MPTAPLTVYQVSEPPVLARDRKTAEKFAGPNGSVTEHTLYGMQARLVRWLFEELTP